MVAGSKSVLHEAEQSYQRWLSATSLERLSLIPGGDELADGRWTRLNARVASMLFAAMTAEQRTDMISHRISTSSLKMLYRLHTVYQPGEVTNVKMYYDDYKDQVVFLQKTAS